MNIPKEDLRRMYWGDKKTIPEIAQEMGLSGGTIHKRMVRVGIERRPPGLKGSAHPMKRPEVREKLSKALRGRKFSLEHRRKLSDAMRSRKLSLEHRKAISNGMKKSDKVLRGGDNPARRPEVKKKIGNALKGRVFSNETRKKMSEAHKRERKTMAF